MALATIPPAVLQIESHAYLAQDKLIAAARSHVRPQSLRPLRAYKRI